MRRTAVALFLVALSCFEAASIPVFAADTPSTAQPTKLPAVSVESKSLAPMEAYFGPPKTMGIALSPNGKYIATSVPNKGRMNLAVVDLGARSINVLTSFENFDVAKFAWVNNKRLVFSLGNVNEPRNGEHQRGGGLYAIDRDGTNPRVLTESAASQGGEGRHIYRGFSYLGPVPDDGTESDDVLALSNERSIRISDVVRLNTRTGRKQLLTPQVPQDTEEWVLDHAAVPRIAVAHPSGTQTIVYYRDSADSPWQEIHRAELGRGSFDPDYLNFIPLAFDFDNRTLYVATNEGGRDRAAIFKFDPTTKKLGDLVAEHPLVDVTSGLQFDRDKKKLVGITINADRPVSKWFDPDYEQLQKMLDAALPGTSNRFTRARIGGEQKVLVASESDRQPERFYILDEAKRTLEEVLSTNDKLGPAQLVEQRPIVIPTRDGKRIPGYLFLPKDYKAGQRLPLLIDVHGGPMARADFWGWGNGVGVMEGQFFASRGYAVLLPNFRMTPGFGADIFASGLREIGRKMSEDKEDALAWAVSQGIADAKRVCIFGHSYGGYAALAGLVKTPDLYRCGVASMAPSDLRLMLTSAHGNIAGSEWGVQFWEALAGNLKTETDFVDAASPAFHAARIKAPLLIIHGEDDTQVPLEQAEHMRDALRKVGKEPEWLVVPEEGHGFGKAENRYLMYTKMLDFFDRQLGVDR